jgi:hypothetical protein
MLLSFAFSRAMQSFIILCWLVDEDELALEAYREPLLELDEVLPEVVSRWCGEEAALGSAPLVGWAS